MQRPVFILFVLHSLFFVFSCSENPCKTYTALPDAERRATSLVLEPDGIAICDRGLDEDKWYRVISGAGDEIATAPPELLHCSTMFPAWMNGPLPDKHTTVDRQVCVVTLMDQCEEQVMIKVRNCGQYYVYKLKNFASCSTAYCFGTETKCPENESSETGFTPGCAGGFPDDSFQASVIPMEHVDTTQALNPIVMKFKCSFNAIDDRLYDIAWYINDIPVTTFKNMERNDLDNGMLMESHWKDKFKLGMMVGCVVRARYAKNSTPGPFNRSPPFFAGIEILDEVIVVEEGKSAKIRLRPTIPVGCAFGEAWRDQCFVDVLVHIPKYDEEQCDAGINGNTITFSDQRCGVRITSSAWDSEVSAEITTFPDGHIDSDPVILYIYLKSLDVHLHDIWSEVILPNVKVLVLDEDGVKTSKKYCKSYNDPHMTTFDGRRWENQWYAAEYVLYRSDVYPISVNAQYQRCNRGLATCNCGIAVRSYMSLFVANFCGNNNYQHGVGHINSYIEKRGCDDQQMVVQTNGNKYVITLPNGAVVRFEYANVYGVMGLQRVTVQASVLDWELSSGLCGYLNNDKNDDFKLRNSQVHTQNKKTFSDSWRVNAADSLFETDVVLDVAEEDLRSYCVCDEEAIDDGIFDKLTCSETKGIQLCGSDTTENTGIYYTDCSGNKGKRDVYGSDSIVGPIEASLFRSLEIPESTEEWTDEKATAYCEKYIGQSALASLCNETVGIEVDPYVEACILDIKYTNDTAYASVTLDTFKEICVTEGGRNITFSKSASPVNGTNTTMLEYMLERSCKNDCSDHGVCIQGLCNCTGGYIDVDCSQHRETPPIIFGIPNYGRCDSISRPCEMISVVGSNIASSDIHCRVREYKLQENSTEKHDVPGVHMTQGIRQSYGVAFCKFPENSRKKREADKDTVATGYYVSLGYDGLHFSDEYTVIVYDGSCFNCSEDSVCVMKDDCPGIPVKDAGSKVSNIWAPIVGGVVGGSLVAIAVIVIILIFVKKRNLRRSKTSPSNPDLRNKQFCE